MRRPGINSFAASVLAWTLASVGAQGALQFTTLLSFDGTNGAFPKGDLIQGPDRRLYGTSVEGGSNKAGTVFALALDGSGFTNLYSFTGGNDGANPSAGLVQDDDGLFYGTAFNGGANGSGTVFRITSGGDLTTIAALSTNTGANPDSSLVLAGDGSLYGTTDMYGENSDPTWPGGYKGYGSIFRVMAQGELEATVLFANTNGDSPIGGLVLASDGFFYGTTRWGGSILSGTPYNVGYGTIYRCSTNGTLTTLYGFTGANDGSLPYAGLVQGLDGNLYGVATWGGRTVLGYGSIFRITLQGQFTKLHTFTGYDGINPYARLTLASDGNFYGTAYVGGPASSGTIFQITTNGDFTGLHAFSGKDGISPLGRLLQADDGNFYGTTASGGTYTNGTVFRLSVPLSPVIQGIAWTNGAVACTWTAVASQSYQLQYTSDLNTPTWTSVGASLTATSGTLSTVDPSPSDRQRFYRVQVLP